MHFIAYANRFPISDLRNKSKEPWNFLHIFIDQFFSIEIAKFLFEFFFTSPSTFIYQLFSRKYLAKCAFKFF